MGNRVSDTLPDISTKVEGERDYCTNTKLDISDYCTNTKFIYVITVPIPS